MAGWRDSIADASGSTVAAPVGMQQQAEDYTGNGGWRESIDEGSGGWKQPVAASGGRYGSTENGWNTAFTEKMMNQRAKAEKAGTLGTLADSDDYTGVVLWNQKSAKRGDLKLGDVYEDGEYQGNVLDGKDMDEKQGYLLLAEYSLSKEERAAAFEKVGDNPQAVKQAVNLKAEANARLYPAKLSQEKFQGAVKDQKDEWNDADETAAVVAAGAAGGAALGGSIGALLGTFVLPGAATVAIGAIGAGIGAGVGALGAFMNRDSLIDQAARATVMTEMAAREDEAEGGAEGGGPVAAVGTFARSWGQFVQSAMSPLQNLTQGTVEAASGRWGDQKAEWYEMDERPLYLEVLGTGALLGDSLLQFGSPVARTITQGTMGAMAAGGAAQVGTTGLFDDRRGQFHQGEDAGQQLAQATVVGIDAVQFGGLGAMRRAAVQQAARTGGQKTADTWFTKMIAQENTAERMGARTFYLDAVTGERKVRTNFIQLLAPSEQVGWVNTRLRALRDGQRGVALTADDLYAAATKIEPNIFKGHIVNALGEGYEEAAQAVFEPLGHGWTVDGEEVLRSAIAGAAGGAGFSVGSRLGLLSKGDAEHELYNQIMDEQGLPRVTLKEYRALGKSSMTSESVRGKAFDAATQEAQALVMRENQPVGVRATTATSRYNDDVRLEMASELANRNESLERTWLLSLAESPTFQNHTVRMSLDTVIDALQKQRQGFLDAAGNKSVDEIEAALALKTAKLTTAGKSTKGAELSAEQQKDAAALAESLGKVIDMVIKGKSAHEATQDLRGRQKIVEQVNGALQGFWHGVEADQTTARSLGLVFARDPRDNSGSFQLLLPQISSALTERRANGIVQVGGAVLKPLSADFDGDQLRLAARMVLNVSQWESARIGDNIRAVRSEQRADVALIPPEEEILRDMGIAFAAGDSAAASRVEDSVNALIKRFRRAFKGLPNLKDSLASLKEGFLHGDQSAQERFLDEILSHPAARRIALKGQPGTLPAAVNLAYYVQDRISIELHKWSDGEDALRTMQTDLRAAAVIPRPENMPHVAPKRGATLGVDLDLQSPGNVPLRQAQGLQYGKTRSATTDADLGVESDRQWMKEWYIALTSGTTRDAVETLLAKDEVTNLAMQMLTNLRRGLAEQTAPQPVNLAQAAMMLVPNFDRNGNDLGGMIPAAEAVLRDASEQLEQRDARILALRPELGTAYASYRSLRGGAAARAIFEGIPNATLVPREQAALLGPTETFGGTVGRYLNQGVAGRRKFRDKLTGPGTPYGDAPRQDLPITTESVMVGDINGYRVLVDIMTETVAAELTQQEDGSTSGRLVDRDEQDVEKLGISFANLRQWLFNVAGRYGVVIPRDGSLDPQQLMRILDGRPGLANSLYEAYSRDVRQVLFDAQADGSIIFPSWFFDVILETNADRAVMMYLRETVIAKFNVTMARAKAHKRSDDRLIDLMLRLDDVQLAKFMNLLTKSTSVKAFMQGVNKQFVFDEAPHLALTRDVALVDPTITRGGWARSLPSVEARQALDRFHDKTSKLQNEFETSKMAADKDKGVLASLRTGLADGTLSRQDARFRRLEHYLNAARILAGMNTATSAGVATPGPLMMMRAAVAGLRGFTGSAADKAAASPEFHPLGEHVANSQTAVLEEGTEQLYAAMTANSEYDFVRNPALLMNAQEIVLDDGKKIDWPGLDAESFIRLSANPRFMPFLNAVVNPSVWEFNELTQRNEQRLLVGASISDLLDGKVYLNMLHGSGFRNQILYALSVDGIAHQFGEDFPLFRWAMDIAIERAERSTKVLTPWDEQRMIEDALSTVVKITRLSAGLSPERLRTAIEEAMPDPGFWGHELDGSAAVEENITLRRAAVLQPFADAVTEAELAHSNGVGTERAVELARDALRRIEDQVNGTPVVQRFVRSNIIDFDGDPTLREGVQRRLYSYALRHRDAISSLSQGERLAYKRLLKRSAGRGSNGIPTLAGNAKDLKKQWDLISSAVTQLQLMEHFGGLTGVRSTPQLYVDDAANMAKYFDDSRQYLLGPLQDVVAGDESGALRAAETFRTIALPENVVPDALSAELSNVIRNELFQENSLAPWHPDLAHAHVAAQVRFTTAGSALQITRPGYLYESQSAFVGATKYSYKAADSDNTRKYLFSLTPFLRDDLPETADLKEIKDPTSKTAQTLRTIPAGLLNGRFATRVTVMYTDDQGQEQEIDLLKGKVKATARKIKSVAAVDLWYIRRALESNPTPAGATNLRLSIDFFHPADVPVTDPNNIFYVGVLAEAAPQASPFATDAFAPGGANPRGQRFAMDSIKTNEPAVRNPQLPTRDVVRSMESIANIQEMLEAKVKHLIPRETGVGVWGADRYTTMLHRLTMQHAVRGFVITPEGVTQPVFLSAVEVRAQQESGATQLTFKVGSDDLVVQSPELYKIPAPHLRTYLGDTGPLALQRPLLRAPSFEIDNWGAWKGTFDQAKLQTLFPGMFEWHMENGLPVFTAGTIEESVIVNRPPLAQLSVQPVHSLSEQDTMRTRRDATTRVSEAARLRRRELAGAVRQNLQAGIYRNLAEIRNSESLRALFPKRTAEAIGLALAGQVSDSPVVQYQGAARNNETLQHDLNLDRGGMLWRYRHGGQRDGGREQGFINGVEQLRKTPSEQKEAAVFDAVAHDGLVIDLGELVAYSAPGYASAELEEVLTEATSSGLTVIFIDPNARGGDLRGAASQILESMLYHDPAGVGVWMPIQEAEGFQNQAARDHQDLVITQLSRSGMQLRVHMDKAHVFENAIYVNGKAEEGNEYLWVSDLVPTGGWPFFGTPQESGFGSEIAELFNDLDSEPGYEHLARLSMIAEEKELPPNASFETRFAARRDELVEEMKDRLTKAIDNLDVQTGLPSEGSTLDPGDFVALVHPGGQVIITRHGYKSPKLDIDAINFMMEQKIGESKPQVAMYGTEPFDAATVRSAVIEQWLPSNGYGLRAVERVSLSLYLKLTSEETGFKGVVVPLDDTGIEFHDGPIVGDMQVGTVSSGIDEVKKGSTLRTIVGAQDAAGHFGLDSTRMLAEGLFGIGQQEWTGLGEEGQADLRGRVRDALDQLQRSFNGQTLPPEQLRPLIRMGANPAGTVQDILLDGLTSIDLGGMDLNWILNEDQRTAAQRITLGSILYLLSPGAKIEHFLTIPGVLTKSSDGSAESFLPPNLWAGSLFDNLPDNDPVRLWFRGQLNKQVAVGANGQKNLWLDENLEAHIRLADGRIVDATLQFIETHTPGASSTMVEQAHANAGMESASVQQSRVAQQAFFGASSRQVKGKLKKTTQFVERTGLTQVIDQGDLSNMLLGIGMVRPRVGPVVTQSRTQKERVELSKQKNSMEEFDQPLDHTAGRKTDKWKKGEYEQYVAARDQIAGAVLSSADEAVYIDYWVRRILARPHVKDSEDRAFQGVVSFRDALLALEVIQENLSQGRYPTWGGAVPAMDAREVRALYRHSQATNGWQPRRIHRGGVESQRKDWISWVDIAIGEMKVSRGAGKGPLIFSTTVDGLLQTFAPTTNDPTIPFPISFDELKQLNLIDLETGLLQVSFDPYRNEMLRADPLYETDGTPVENRADFREFTGTALEEAQRAVSGRLYAWAKKNNVPLDVATSIGDFEKKARTWRHEATTTTGFLKGLLFLRQFNGMSNVWLAVSAPMEALYRGTILEAGNLLTGQSTGRLGTFQSQVAEWATRKGFADTPLGEALGLRIDPVVTSKIQRQIDGLTTSTMNSPEFRGLLSSEFELADTDYHSRTLRVLAKGVNMVGKWQDPFWGMPPRHATSVYIGQAVRHLANTGMNAAQIQTVLTEFATDPLAFAKLGNGDAHTFALNSVKNLRGIKRTSASVATGDAIEALASHSNGAVNFLGNLLLKIPYTFQNFGWNLAINLTGAQALDALTSVAMQGNSAGRKWGRMHGWLSGRGGDYDAERDGTDVLAETLESIDFADTMIRSGTTHTALLAGALLLGAGGFDGEDEEDKRRRRAEEVQGSGHVYDPRDLANDYRNADALFVDNLWPFGEMFKRVGEDGETSSPVDLHWTLKQFISPALGIAKFLKTGNLDNITQGFEDAIGSMPLVNTMFWDDAAHTSQELWKAAESAARNGGVEALPETANFFMSGVMFMERMLFENAFVNSIYVAADTYDRDPWKLTDVDENGNPIVNKLGEPELGGVQEEVQGDDGTLQDRYIRVDEMAGNLRQYSESRATLGFIGSLFTGALGMPTLNRYGMAVRTHTIEKAELGAEDAEGLILSLWDENNQREVLTREGGEAVILGLHMQTVKPGDPALDNVFLNPEDRRAVQDSLMAKILQEGYDLGLDEDQAEDRLSRIMYGDPKNPSLVPLADVIWSQGRFEESIGFKPNHQYRQLNTTYITGPDGYPVATGVQRGTLYAAFGQAPITPYVNGEMGLPVDGRLNSVDFGGNLNTGMRALEKIDNESEYTPKTEDIIKALEDGFKDVIEAIKAPTWSEDNPGGYYRYGSYGYGGGGGGGGYAFRVNSPVRNDPTYGRNVPYVNVDNPIIRRATIRRERFSSTRGRLNQWQ